MKFQLWHFYIITLLERAGFTTGFYIPNCKELKPVKYCPDYDSAQWRIRLYCQNCTGKTKYHCCKDYDSPKLNCPQDNIYCEDEIFVEGCAEEKFCKIGEEPVLNFIKYQVRIEDPEVYCELCYNKNRYNSFKNKSSATYSECPERKKNICTPDKHKIECGKPSDETSDRLCRCDVDNGYSPYSHPDDHPVDGCSYTDYTCNIGCKPNERMLLNYTCICKDGCYKHNNSGECVPLHITTTIYIAVCGVVGILFAVIFVMKVLRPCRNMPATETEDSPNLSEQIPLGVLESNHEQDFDKSCSDENSSLFQHNSNSTLHLSQYTPGSQPSCLSTKDKINVSTKNFCTEKDGYSVTNSLDRQIYNKGSGKFRDEEEYRDFVQSVLKESRLYLIDNLEPLSVLDHLEHFGHIRNITVKDIKDQTKTSDKNRQLLDTINSNYKSYRFFKSALENTKQSSCLQELKRNEQIAYNKISKNETRTTDNGQRRRHTISTSSTGFEFNKESKYPINGNRSDEDASDFSDKTSVCGSTERGSTKKRVHDND